MKNLSFLLAAVGLVVMTSCNRTPTATFTADSTSVVAGDVVTFTNTSEDGYNAIWDFGDGTQSMTYSPTHVYASPGTYAVTLQVENKKGSEVVVSAATSITVAEMPVEAPPAPALSVSASAVDVFAGEMVTFTGTSENAYNLAWNFGDGGYNGTGLLTVMHRYYEEGSFNVTLQGTNEAGDEVVVATVTVNVTIEPDPADPVSDGAEEQQALEDELREEMYGTWNYENEDHDYDQEVGGYNDYDNDYDRDYRFHTFGNEIFITENDVEVSGNKNWTSSWSHIVDNFIQADGWIWEVTFDDDEMIWTRERYYYYNDWQNNQDYYITETVVRTFVKK